MADAVLRLSACDTRWQSCRVHSAPGHGSTSAGTSLFIFYTPAEIHRPQGPLINLPTPPTLPRLTSTGVKIQTPQILTRRLNPTSINVHRLKLIILSTFPCFWRSALCSCSILWSWGSMIWICLTSSASFLFFCFRSRVLRLSFDETEIDLPYKSFSNRVFFRVRLADRDIIMNLLKWRTWSDITLMNHTFNRD